MEHNGGIAAASTGAASLIDVKLPANENSFSQSMNGVAGRSSSHGPNVHHIIGTAPQPRTQVRAKSPAASPSKRECFLESPGQETALGRETAVEVIEVKDSKINR